MAEEKPLENAENNSDLGKESELEMANGIQDVASEASSQDNASKKEGEETGQILKEDEDTDQKLKGDSDSLDSNAQSVKNTADDRKADSKTSKGEEEDGDGFMDILGSGQLTKRVVQPGQGGSIPSKQGMQMTVSYQGFLEDGTEVEKQNNFTFVQGEGEIVEAINMAACFMRPGEIAEIQTNSRFAYGEHGNGSNIPPNTDLLYRVELLEMNPPPDPTTMTVKDRCQWADKKRGYGNEMFTRGDYSGAINSYTRALKLLNEAPSSSEEDEKKELSDLLIKCQNNLAAAQLKIEAYSAALQSCNAVLRIDENNIKALFRKGKVLACQKEFTEAVAMMKKALAVEPANKTIHQELSKLTSRKQEDLKSEKQMYQKMVGDMANVSDVDVPSQKKRFGTRTLLIGLSLVIAAVAVVIALYLK